MKKTTSLVVGFMMITVASMLSASPGEITLPVDSSTLRESTLPGYTLAQQKCGICHSANYVSYQPPGMTLAQWIAEMKKMQHSYGAPIDEDEIQLIGAYLAVEYGSASADDAEVVALTNAAKNDLKTEVANPAANPVDKAAAVDVQGLLAANACLGCHAIDKKVVGPSFQDVAAKYAETDGAQANLAKSISQGGTGKWGMVAMPPMSNLSDSDAQSLAEFVLKQNQ